MRRVPAPRSGAHQAGFTILELILTLLIVVEILIGAGIAFDVHNRMARIQTQITDMQQSLRIAQYDMTRMVRMAGRGGLAPEILPTAAFNAADTPPVLSGIAIEVRNNVGGTVNADPDRNIARGDANSPLAVEGTDILIVRGCFSTPLYNLNEATFDWDPDGDGSAGPTTLVLTDPGPTSLPQPILPLKEEADSLPGGNLDGWMVLASPESRQVYGLGDITGAAFTGPDDALTQVSISLNLPSTTPLNPINTAIAPPARMFPPRMTAALACLLEEYRYYVREEYEVPGDVTSEMRPRLARARFEPGTELPYRNDPENLRLDLADGIFDLQVALGFDSDHPSPSPTTTPGSFDDDIDTIGVDDQIFEAPFGDAARDSDDWLYNSTDDEPSDLQWVVHQFPGNTRPIQLRAIRITTLARTSRPDPSYESIDLDGRPGTDVIEDNNYTQAPAVRFRTGNDLKYRHRMLVTVVEPRNF